MLLGAVVRECLLVTSHMKGLSAVNWPKGKKLIEDYRDGLIEAIWNPLILIHCSS